MQVAVESGTIWHTLVFQSISIPSCMIVHCLQADLCRLPQNLIQFDAVLAANVIERLPNPALFLDRLSSLVKPDGVVVLSSAHSWSEHNTPKENWLGGFYKVNAVEHGLTLQAVLSVCE